MPALCHPATGLGMCGRAWLTQHLQRRRREEGKEKPPCSERQRRQLGGCARARAGIPARDGGAGMDGVRLPALSCPGTEGMTVNRSALQRAEAALTPLLKMG